MTLGVGCHEAADQRLMGTCARPETAGDKHHRRMGSSKVEKNEVGVQIHAGEGDVRDGITQCEL